MTATERELNAVKMAIVRNPLPGTQGTYVNGTIDDSEEVMATVYWEFISPVLAQCLVRGSIKTASIEPPVATQTKPPSRRPWVRSGKLSGLKAL